MNAVIAKLNISMFSNQRQDPAITAEVKVLHAMAGKSGKWIKYKVRDESLDPVRKTANRAYAEHRTLTLPCDEGTGFIATGALDLYKERMEAKRAAFFSEVMSWVAQYPTLIEEARQMHNGTFNAADYPPVDAVAGMFAMQWSFRPMPESGHFDDRLRAVYGAALDAEVGERVQEATAEAWNRLLEPIAHMANKLGSDDAIFRDSLVNNVLEMVDLVPAVNIVDNPTLNQAASDIKNVLAGIKGDDLRNNKILRAQVASEAKGFVSQFGAMGSRTFSV